MMHQNKTETTKARSAASFIGRCSLVAVLVVATLGYTAASSGCASSKTRVDPAATNASHTTTQENAGRTTTRTIKLRINPPAADPSTAKPNTPSESRSDQPGDGQSFGFVRLGDRDLADQYTAASPADWEKPNWTQPAGAAVANQIATQPAMHTIAWGGGNRQRDQPNSAIGDAAGLADAIESAVRNGSTIDFEITETDNTPLTTSTIESTLDDHGAGLKTSSDEAAIGFDGRRGASALPYGGRSGKSSFGLDASLLTRATSPLVLLGGIVLLGAIVPILIPPRRIGAAIVIAGMGILLIAAGVVATESPWVYAVVLLAFLGYMAWQGYEMWKRGSVQGSFDAVVRGVDQSTDTHAGIVKGHIERAAGGMIDRVRTEVRKSKKRQGIVKRAKP